MPTASLPPYFLTSLQVASFPAPPYHFSFLLPSLLPSLSTFSLPTLPASLAQPGCKARPNTLRSFTDLCRGDVIIPAAAFRKSGTNAQNQAVDRYYADVAGGRNESRNEG